MSIPLVIIDMQTGFMETGKNALVGVKEEVKRAKRRQDPIILVEFEHWGPTHQDIMKLLDGYPHVTKCFKWTDDGANELLDHADAHMIDLSKVRFCGVNRCYCVGSTIRSFVRKMENLSTPPEVQIAIDATWCHDPGHGRHVLSYYGTFVRTPVNCCPDAYKE